MRLDEPKVGQWCACNVLRIGAFLFFGHMSDVLERRGVKLQVTSPDGGGRHQTGTHDKGRNTEEPGEGKLSSPVLEQRWARRLAHRL